MWLTNEWYTMRPQMWHSWKRIRSVTIVLMVLVSFVCAELKFPTERDALVAKDNNTLLNVNFLPFLSECMKSDPLKYPLCSMYYDIVYNAYELGAKGDDLKKEMLNAKTSPESLGGNFCEIFPDQVSNALDKQPFSQKNEYDIRGWIKMRQVCEPNCLYTTIAPNQVKIKPVCIFMYVGSHWILQKKSIKKEDLPANLPHNPPVETNSSANLKQNPAQDKNENVNLTGVANKLEANSKPDTNAKLNLSSKPTVKAQTKSSDIVNVSKNVDTSIPAVQEPEPAKAPIDVKPTQKIKKIIVSTAENENPTKTKHTDISTDNIEKVIKPVDPAQIDDNIVTSSPSEDETYLNNDQKNPEAQFDNENDNDPGN